MSLKKTSVNKYSPGSSPVDLCTPIANSTKMIGIVRSLRAAIFFVVYVNTQFFFLFKTKKLFYDVIASTKKPHTKILTYF